MQSHPAGAVISARGVAKRFGDTAVLSDVSVDVRPGITGLLGSNGAGKTTFLSMVLGVEKRNGGELAVLGVDPEKSGPELRAQIGYSPEHHHLPEDVQAADLVRHLAQLHGLPLQASTERASDALWLVGLGEERFRPIGTMSTGQRQRVKLAAAIAHDPALVLLDEPTDGLDPVQRDSMLELIHRIGNVYGINVMLSSHLLEEVEKVCDDVIIISEGRVLRSGSLADLSGDRTGVIVELDSGHDAVMAYLQGAGVVVERSGSRLVVEPPPSADGIDEHWVHDHVRNAVAEAGVGLRRLTDRTLSLEDVFLDAGQPAYVGDGGGA